MSPAVPFCLIIATRTAARYALSRAVMSSRYALRHRVWAVRVVFAAVDAGADAVLVLSYPLGLWGCILTGQALILRSRTHTGSTR